MYRDRVIDFLETCFLLVNLNRVVLVQFKVQKAKGLFLREAILFIVQAVVIMSLIARDIKNIIYHYPSFSCR